MEYQPKEQMASCRKCFSDWVIVDFDCRINQKLPRYLMLSLTPRVLYPPLSLRVYRTFLFTTLSMFHVYSWDNPTESFVLAMT